MRARPQRARRPARIKSFPSPVKGWISNENLAIADPQGAVILENIFPTAQGAKMRSGTEQWARLLDESLPVDSMFTYINGNNRKLFAANATQIYDVSIPLSPDSYLLADEFGNTVTDGLGNEVGSVSILPAVVSGLTGGNWVSVQFVGPAGVSLIIVNGLDTPRVYNGTAFVTTPAITGATPSQLSYVWAYKNRLFFVQKGTLDAWYLPVNNIGGIATVFPLGAVFQLGGSLLFGASWSLSEGAGLSASCAFFTTEGEVAVYQGSDPNSATDWQLKGVYRIGRPLGPKAWMRAGGDLVVATDIGLVPLSQSVEKDVAALSPVSPSYPIETAWNDAVSDRPGAYWNVTIWPTNQAVYVALPKFGDVPYEQFVANARTGAWGRYTGWSINCMAVFGTRMFYGGNNGRVVEMEVTGSDLGLPYVSRWAPLFDDLKSSSSIKIALQAKTTMLAPVNPNERTDVLSDYNLLLPAPPDAVPSAKSSVWGDAVWGQSVWGASRVRKTWQEWQSAGASGYALSPIVQVTSSSIAPPDLDFVRMEVMFEQGAIAT